jgi:hypothetical protein
MRSTATSRNPVVVGGYEADREVEALSERIAALAAERQELRRAGASDEVLEENRAQLGRSQWALSHALIEQHLPGFAAA